MLIKIKYCNVKKFVHLDATSDSAEEFILRVCNKFMVEVGDEEIKFQDSDETEIDSEDLIEYILGKQSDSFILNIVSKTSTTNLYKAVNEVLNKTEIGYDLLQEYEANDILKLESRQALIRLLVGHIQNQKLPDNNIKIFYAKGIVQNFPTLGDPSTAEGYELFYNPKDRSGLSWRLRTVNRDSYDYNVLKKTKEKQTETINSSPENPRIPDSEINENKETV
ncbi:hypothetical protein P5V15_001471 [Pogonomyrmex californicus]